ncbi:lactate permease LctP family transporter [Helicobacter zhangjianzhongii]|uniref:Lactate permease LctP family transporter n=1 Tax=Helicobacter zhangjianzhongii TaxID=2974574 RepID=A0ACC6FQC6_9HELI|nr:MULTISPECIES: lactate permease LctP family transporter [unclassified Helicobacter]MDL0079343.1 lactate permease LctP family transporter [Helicobacter sp. CPD2-1]MDL0081374.1 lactate permease LctP family transporter [Helicobacter sp. XJK30-2]
MWNQIYDPLGNPWLSALVALIPIAVFFISLLVLKLKGQWAGLLTVLSAIIIAVFVYEMPMDKALWSFGYGAFYGLWPIAWIIIAAIFLYKLTVKSGYFDILRESIIAITPDQRIQVILIGFCFGAFLEGAIGFGGPVAITAALLVGLGLRPLYAAGLCLIANTAPVAFGAVGVPITAMAGAVNVPAIEISAMAGHMLPPLSLFVPFFLVFLMNGFKGVKETWPVALVAGGSFAIVQYLTAVHSGPELPDIASAVVSIICVAVFLRFWQPKNIFKFDESVGSSSTLEVKKHSTTDIVLAWLPFVLLIGVILIWTAGWFKDLFVGAGGKLSTGEIAQEAGILAASVLKFDFASLKEVIQVEPAVKEAKAVKSLFELPIINATGTSILIVALITIPLLRIKLSTAVATFGETLNEMKWAIFTIALVVGFAFVSNYSGISATLALALAQTGNAFAFFSPIVGWIGVFLTGSDTSSNLLFGTLQQLTAQQLGISEVLFLAANSVGGVVGKMISPQSIAIACAAVGLAGKESELFRFTVKYSILLVIGIGLFTYAIAFYMQWLIP